MTKQDDTCARPWWAYYIQKDMKHIPTRQTSKSEGIKKRGTHLCVGNESHGWQMVAAPVNPPCRLCRTWVSGSWKPHFPDSRTPEPLDLKNHYTLTWLRTWVHTPGASASSGEKSGCWGILLGVVAAVSAPGTYFGEDGRRDGGALTLQERHMAEAVWSRSPNLGASFLPAAEVNGSLGKLVLSWFLGNRSWEFSLNLFPKTFQWSLHPVESSAAYICYLNLPETNCWPCRWHSADPRGGDGNMAGGIWPVDFIRLVMIGHQEFSYKTVILCLRKILET